MLKKLENFYTVISDYHWFLSDKYWLYRNFILVTLIINIIAIGIAIYKVFNN